MSDPSCPSYSAQKQSSSWFVLVCCARRPHTRLHHLTPNRNHHGPIGVCQKHVFSVQFLLFACDPYETIGFKVPNLKIDKAEGRFFTNWDKESKKFTVRRILLLYRRVCL